MPADIVGGWFKVYELMLDDPKFDKSRMNPVGFQAFVFAMAFVSRSPWTQKKDGWLYHADGFPVEAPDFYRRIDAPTEEIDAALENLCTVGGKAHSLMVRDEKKKAWGIPKWRKWQEGSLRDFSRKSPLSLRDRSGKSPSRARARASLDFRRKTLDKNSAAGAARASCVFCVWREEHPQEHLPEPGADGYGPRWRPQLYHDLAVNRLGMDCLAITGKELKLLASAVKAHGEETLWDWWGEFLSQKSSIGHSLAVFCSTTNLNACAERRAKRQPEPQP